MYIVALDSFEKRYNNYVHLKAHANFLILVIWFSKQFVIEVGPRGRAKDMHIIREGGRERISNFKMSEVNILRKGRVRKKPV